MAESLPTTCLSRYGVTRGTLCIDVPVGVTREQAMSADALRLVAANPILQRTESATIGLGAVGSVINVMARDLSWADEWLIIEHVPPRSKMRVWPIPGRHWERPVEADDVAFDEFTIRWMGLDGWKIYRGDVLMTEHSFASVEQARNHITIELRSKQIS